MTSRMEIEFNTNRIARADSVQPAVKPQVARAETDAAVFPSVASLEAGLSNVPEVRTDKVQQARDLVTNVQYPPNDVLDRIAVLLALNHNP